MTKNALFALLALLCAACPGQTIASRRYAERTPYQYQFGPLLALAPFNQTPNYAGGTTTQLQPSGLITSDNTCASATNFAVLEQTSPAATFSVASDVCTVATGSSGGVYVLGDANSSFSVPSAFISVQINTAGSYEFGPVLSNATGSIYLMADLYNSTSCNLVLYDGSYNNITLSACTAPGAGGYVGLSLVGNDACMWISTNGTNWTVTGCGSTSSVYNFETVGNLTGFKAGVRVTAVSTTWKFQNLASGLFGATAVRDFSLVTYPDGRPYINGPTAYFTGSSLDPDGATYDGVYTLNVGTNALTEIGEIWNNRGGALVGDCASHLIYDPGTVGYRYFVGGWGTGSNQTFYEGFARSSIDPLAGGVVTVAATTQLTTAPGFDAHAICSAWNYSTNACANWLDVSISSTPYIYTSTADPSANTWTAIGTAGGNLWEGGRWLRTATGPGGVSYIVATGGDSLADLRSYETMSKSAVAGINLDEYPLPGGFRNAPHPQFFTYGNTAYFVTFDDTASNLTSGTTDSMGNLGLATAPRYGAQTNWPEFVGAAAGFSGGTSVTSQSTSATINVAAGDLIVGMCRGGNGATTSFAASSSPANTFTMEALNLISTGAGTGADEGFYSFATSTGATTFTCTVGPSQLYVGITVLVYTPGFLTTTDYIAYQNQLGVSLPTYTSGSFSTTARGLVVICADGLFGSQFTPGLIGPFIPGGSFGMTEGSPACEATATTGAQASITASVGAGVSNTPAQWGGIVFSFK